MREEILNLLKKQEFISGEYLAQQLEISRTAVWKHVQLLKNQGYEIESVKHKGYRLISCPDLPIKEEITRNLKTRIIGKELYYFQILSSTNNYAKTLVKKHVPEGTTVVSEMQTEGRGRKERVWSSPPGGLWFSVILYPSIPPHYAMMITMAASVAVAEAIKELTDLQPQIKWPNDLLVSRKKICGILTELDAEIDQIHYLIVGIGINVNNPLEKHLQGKATSLQQELGYAVSRVRLLRRVLQKLDEFYEYLTKGKYEVIRRLWFSHADIIGKEIVVHGEREIISGTVLNVDVTGTLIIQTSDGEKRVVTGDIEL